MVGICFKNTVRYLHQGSLMTLVWDKVNKEASEEYLQENEDDRASVGAVVVAGAG